MALPVAICFTLTLYRPPARAREATEAEAWVAAALARGAARFAECEGRGTFDEHAGITPADARRTLGAGVLRASLLAPPGPGAAEGRLILLAARDLHKRPAGVTEAPGECVQPRPVATPPEGPAPVCRGKEGASSLRLHFELGPGRLCAGSRWESGVDATFRRQVPER